MASAAENILQNAVYHGERKNNTFERYITIQKEQHTILGNLEENGYRGINERSKFWYLIAGIKSSTLNFVNTTALAYSPYCQDFDACVALYKDYIKQAQDIKVEFNISGIGIKASESPGKENLTDDIEDKY